MSGQLSGRVRSMNGFRSRKEELDRLFANLSPWDILYLRKKIGGTTISLAGLQDLPPELVCAVLSYLDFDDYQRCVQVSRKWREVWKRESVLTQALRLFFPGLQLTYPKASPQSLYTCEVQKHIKWRRPHGSYIRSPWNIGKPRLFVDNHPDFNENGTRGSDGPCGFQYNKNKLVWQWSPYNFIVDDLRTLERLWFIPPGSVMSGGEYEAAAISDKVLVLLELKTKGRTVHLVHLGTREWKRLTLPAALECAHAESETVYFQTLSHIMHFTWGGRLKQLDYMKIYDHHEGPALGDPKVLPHPTKDNVVFIVRGLTHDYKDTRLCSFFITKFEDGLATWNSIKSIPNPLRNPQPDCHDYSWAVVSLLCQKSDDHGTFCIGLYRMQGSETSRLELCPCCEPQTRRGDWGAISFNVLTQTFQHHEYLSTRLDVVWDGGYRNPLHDQNLIKLENVYLWNNDLVLAATKTLDNYNHDIYLQTLHPLGSHESPAPQWAPVRITCILQVGETQIFQNDDFLILPTLGGLILYKPSEKPCNERIIDDSWKIPGGARSELIFDLWSMSHMLELKHTEDGCGLISREERRTGRPASP
ncbi:hypothetical protein FLONG3_10599 [Fusarium longipes]|uniref:F-box domain-containing protein n=1 Tax=Fusarium longipes TaxID=694270 RepID=A0A395RME1_9HYPO|nr:hypothetical protein FLONG3_10599 [Fusarium longipes]